MNHNWTQLREVVTSVHKLKVKGFCITKANIQDDKYLVKCRCSVDGHYWEIRFHPALYVCDSNYCPGLELVFVGESLATSVTAILSGKIIALGGDADLEPFEERKSQPRAFSRRLDQSHPIYLGVGRARDDFRSCSLTVECAVTVFRERQPEAAIPVPSPDLSQHLSELLRSKAGSDVTFAVSGKSFAAHKAVLAVRSPVFMAEFFGEMEKDARLVEVQDVDDVVFKAMLHFIYTDAVPEFDEKPGAATTTALAQHLLVAADMYGLDRLKAMCEQRLALGLDVSMVAMTLALAEQHSCPRLKAKCTEFIAGGSSEDLDAVLATEGYKYLVESSPSVLAELLKAGHGKKRGRSPDSNN